MIIRQYPSYRLGFSTVEAMIAATIFILVISGGYRLLHSVARSHTAQSNSQTAQLILQGVKSRLISYAGREFDSPDFEGNWIFCFEPGSHRNFKFIKDALPDNCHNRHFQIMAQVTNIQMPENIRLVDAEVKWKEGSRHLERKLNFTLGKSRTSIDGQRLVVAVKDCLDPNQGIEGIRVESLNKDDLPLTTYTNSLGIAYLNGIKREERIPVRIFGDRRIDPDYYFRGPDINPDFSVWRSTPVRTWQIEIPDTVTSFSLNDDAVPPSLNDDAVPPVGDILMCPYGQIQGTVTRQDEDGDGAPHVRLELYPNRTEIPHYKKVIYPNPTDTSGNWHAYVLPGFYSIIVGGTLVQNPMEDERDFLPWIQDPDLRDLDETDVYTWPIFQSNFSPSDTPTHYRGLYDKLNYLRHDIIGQDNPTLDETYTCDTCIRILPEHYRTPYDSATHPSGDHGEPYHYNKTGDVNHDEINAPLNTHFRVMPKSNFYGVIRLAEWDDTEDQFDIPRFASKLRSQQLNLLLKNKEIYRYGIETIDVNALPVDPSNEVQFRYGIDIWGASGDFWEFYKVNGHNLIGTILDSSGRFSFQGVGHAANHIHYRNEDPGTDDTQFQDKILYHYIPGPWEDDFAPALIATHPDQPQHHVFIVWLGPEGSSYSYGVKKYSKPYVSIPSLNVFLKYHKFQGFQIEGANTGLENWPKDYYYQIMRRYPGDVYAYDILFRPNYIDQYSSTTELMALAREDLGTITGDIINVDDGSHWFYEEDGVPQALTGTVRTIALTEDSVNGDHFNLAHAESTIINTTAGAWTHTFEFNDNVLPSLPRYRRDPNNDNWIDTESTDPDDIFYNWFEDPSIITNTHPVDSFYSANWGGSNERYVFFSFQFDDTDQSRPHYLMLKAITRVKDLITGNIETHYLETSDLSSYWSNLEFAAQKYSAGTDVWSDVRIDSLSNPAPMDNVNTSDDTWTRQVAARLNGDQPVPSETYISAVSEPIFVLPEGNRNDIPIRVPNETSEKFTTLFIYLKNETNFFDLSRRRDGNGVSAQFCDTNCGFEYDPIRISNPLGYYETSEPLLLAVRQMLDFVSGTVKVEDPDPIAVAGIRVDCYYRKGWGSYGWNFGSNDTTDETGAFVCPGFDFPLIEALSGNNIHIVVRGSLGGEDLYESQYFDRKGYKGMPGISDIDAILKKKESHVDLGGSDNSF